MTGMPWVKSYTALLSNPRYAQLPDTARLHYRELLDLAGYLDAGGIFMSDDGHRMSVKDIAYFLRTDLPTLESDIKLLVKAKFVYLNGHGPEIKGFLETQGPGQEERHTKWCERQKRHRDKLNVTGVSHVTSRMSRPVTSDRASESESESESDIESESEESQSVKEIVQQPTDDDQSLTDRKRLICTHAGIPPKFAKPIIRNYNGLITPADILAELARNYSRKGKVKNPGYVTGMNLARITPEKAAADWYAQARWLQYLPSTLKSKLGLDFQSEPEGLDTLLDVTTRNAETEKPHALTTVESAWQNALEQLRQDMPKASYNKYLKPTHALYVLDDKFVVEVGTLDAAEWLESRVASTASRLLAGIMDRDVTVRFTVQKETP